MDSQPAAEERFEVDSDPTKKTLGRRRTVGPAFRIVASCFTAGLVKIERRAKIFIRDRLTNQVVATCDWQNIDAALRDLVTIEEDLRNLDVSDFAERYAIPLDPPS